MDVPRVSRGDKRISFFSKKIKEILILSLVTIYGLATIKIESNSQVDGDP